eukprot:5574652-Amphidinium_carterae.1
MRGSFVDVVGGSESHCVACSSAPLGEFGAVPSGAGGGPSALRSAFVSSSVPFGAFGFGSTVGTSVSSRSASSSSVLFGAVGFGSGSFHRTNSTRPLGHDASGLHD